MDDARDAGQGRAGERSAVPRVDEPLREPRIVATFYDYADAQAAVDQLSDDGFPVEHLAIVGHGLRTVEVVTGRHGYPQAALSGAVSGAVLGGFLGAIFGLLTLFEPLTSALVLALWGLLLGAVLGALLGLASHALTGGHRDFDSVRSLEAERYDIVAEEDHAEEAGRRLTSRR